LFHWKQQIFHHSLYNIPLLYSCMSNHYMTCINLCFKFLCCTNFMSQWNYKMCHYQNKCFNYLE
jgi:hypothetical protein